MIGKFPNELLRPSAEAYVAAVKRLPEGATPSPTEITMISEKADAYLAALQSFVVPESETAYIHAAHEAAPRRQRMSTGSGRAG